MERPVADRLVGELERSIKLASGAGATAVDRSNYSRIRWAIVNYLAGCETWDDARLLQQLEALAAAGGRAPVPSGPKPGDSSIHA